MQTAIMELGELATSRPVRRFQLLNSVTGSVVLVLALVVLLHQAMSNRSESPASSSPTDNLAVLRWERSPIFAIAWSPNGKQLAVSSFGPVVRVWQPESGECRWLEAPTTDPRFVLGWSIDGQKLAIGSLKVPVESWWLDGSPQDDDQVSLTMENPSRALELLARSSQGRSIRLWGPSDQRSTLLPACLQSATTVAFSIDGQWIASGNVEGILQVWDRTLGKVRQTWFTDHRGINSLAFSPDSSKLISGGGGPVRVWDLVDGRELASLSDWPCGSSSVAFSPDGTRVAAATWDGSIRVWDLATRREQFRRSGHSGQIITLAWSPDGTTIATGGYDSTVRLWDVTEPKRVALAD